MIVAGHHVPPELEAALTERMRVGAFTLDILSAQAAGFADPQGLAKRLIMRERKAGNIVQGTAGRWVWRGPVVGTAESEP